MIKKRFGGIVCAIMRRWRRRRWWGGLFTFRLSSSWTSEPLGGFAPQSPRLFGTMGADQLPGGLWESAHADGPPAHLSLPRPGGHALQFSPPAAQDVPGEFPLRDAPADESGCDWPPFPADSRLPADDVLPW